MHGTARASIGRGTDVFGMARIVEGVNETWQRDELTGESYYDLITAAVVGRRVAGSAVRFDSSSTEGHRTLGRNIVSFLLALDGSIRRDPHQPSILTF